MNQAKVPGADLGLERKQVVVLGVADESSIAWGIAEAFQHAGSRVRIGFQQKFFSRVRQLFQKHPGLEGQRCDVLNEAELRDFFESMGERRIDVLVHSIAFGAPEVFTKLPSAVSPEAISQALAVSAYSLPLVVGQAKSRLGEWSSVISLSFLAAQRAAPMYGLMGVAKSALESATRYLALELGSLKARINTISAGPVETLAALGILLAFAQEPAVLAHLPGDILSGPIAAVDKENPGLRESDPMAWARLAWRHLQERFAAHSALPEFVCKEDVANCALFLGSDLSRKITGQVFHVDAGLSSSLIL
ncbi:MAG: SDR family oxidoreductase [Acidobacteria bacterium]|nr:MAG: SDR family oxidoreductase [Acidobacteriota bacterium]